MLTHPDQAVVTEGAGYDGRYVARRLLEDGVRVGTLTRDLDREDPFAGRVKALLLDFPDPGGCASPWRGRASSTTSAGFGSKWGGNLRAGVEKSRLLFEVAAKAGVGRFVHFSITNPSNDYDLPYFRGKELAEEILKGMGMPYAIIRPTLVFGRGDLLLNDMAEGLRRFGTAQFSGRGDFMVQPSSQGTYRLSLGKQ